ncbi:titin-like [Leguminivora glycinivorella]|uniref:titin-like n=1 Tax=Leguminivora glycinivorella TaxID=1035111 RepID=UPI00200D25B9|nr:titin-like [Leguminivora glycinivorella]
MEVEVRLTRTGEEPWGFRLIGGADFNMPLTVVKVLPDSPADLAGIRNGDTVASIQGEKAATMTHDGAKAAVATAADGLSLGVMRGLYDLTLDDYDPIDDPLDQDDFDQPSLPTEVFQIQQFGDSPLDSKDSSRSRTGSRGNLDRRSLSEARNDYEQRSLTESPYFLNTKHYRPFSTEPSPIPPLEKPIILNPNYHDEFGKFDDGLEPPRDLPNVDEFAGILSEKSRYKLPISKQYDPDGTKLKKTKEITTVTKTVEETIVTEEIVTKEVKVTSVEERLVEQKEDAKFMEKMKKDIDLETIEMTATSIVDESIEKAVIVADEIKKEIDLELSAVTSECKTNSSDMETVVSTSVRKESSKEVCEMSESIKKTNDVVVKKSDVSVAKEVAKFEKDDKETIVDERQEFRRQELEETIESGSVRRKSEMYDKDTKIADVKIEKKCVDESIESGSVRRKSQIYDKDVKVADMKVEKISVDETIESGSVRRKSEMFDNDVKKVDTKVENKFTDDSIESGTVRRKSEMYDKNVEIKSVDDAKIERKQSKVISDLKDSITVQSAQQKQTSEIKTEKITTTTENIHKSDENKTKEAKYSTAKLVAEQRAYTIGLQTIPHIRGTVQSNYHYDLLLKTFFIHLTDVMVALSRFILAEPVLSKPLETKPNVTKEATEVTRVERDTVSNTTVVKDSVIDSKSEKTKTEEFEIKDIKQKVEKVADVVKQDHVREVKQQEYTDYVEKIQHESEKREKIVLSGAEMAQLSDKKSGELITKIDGVITEFQTKAGLEEEITMQRERRSRSRSKVDEDIVKEVVPLSKVDTKSQEITEIKTTSSVLESKEIKTETKHEIMDIKKETKHETSEISSKNGKNTYISICEAHVYTNKNSIFDEMAEISEATSMESIKETNIALEANEAMVTERVAIESQSQIKQEAEAVLEAREISSAKTEEVIVQEKKDVIQETGDQKSSIQIESKQAVIEKVETIQPIVELHEDIVEKAVSVEIKNKMNIQEIETSEYIDEVNVVKEESIEVTESHDIKEIQVLEDVSVKAKEESVIIEEIKEEKEDIVSVQEVKESVSVIKEDIKEIVSVKEEVAEVAQDVKIEEIAEEISVVQGNIDISERNLEVKDEYAQLKVTKEEITELEENIEIDQEIEVCIKKSVHIAESENQYQSFISESSIQNSEYVQESSFTARTTEDSSFTSSVVQESTFIARSTEDAKKQLTLDLDSKIKKSDSQSSVKSTISTPTPSTVPPTPLTDEYVFRLQMPLPKLTGPPVPRSPSPEDEDPHIVKKNLVPHIDTEIIEEVVYETPLPTPPEDKSSPPKFTKPGLKGGNMKYVFLKEEIKEIERKSSLLASAIDQTIKSIEEYKEEVGIEPHVDTPLVYNGYAKVIDTKVYKDKLDEVNIEKQIIKNTENINRIVEDRAKSAEDSANRVHLNGMPVNVIVTVENNATDSVTESSENKMGESIETVAVEGYRPVPFNPDEAPHLERVEIRIPEPVPTVDPGKAFVAPNGEIMGTRQGIVDGLEEAVVDEEIAKDLGKPGMTEEKIAAIISGESEMLREAHVMGLSRVLKSHMHRDNDDSSVDFKKIKPIVESLKDSEVLKALNEEFVKTQEEKKKEERKWTKFLQKPARPVPKAKFGYHGWTANDDEVKESPYKVKIVKQPKPKVAPDYKPQDFNTGPLPWEERANNEPPPPPVEAEPPILIPEEKPVFLEAIDNLPETAVPDLEETGIEIPPEQPIEEPVPEAEPEAPKETEVEEVEETKKEEPIPRVEETSKSASEMENRIAEQLMKNVEGMVDPNAPLEQQLAQMRAQLAALAQLPGVIQQTLELVTRQLCQITQQEAQSHHSAAQHQMAIESSEMVEETNETSETTIEDVTEEKDETQIEEVVENGVQEEVKHTKVAEEIKETRVEQVKQTKEEVRKVQVNSSVEEMEKMKREEQEILDEQRRIEKQKKELTNEPLEQEFENLQETPHEIALRFINELMESLLLEKEPKHMKPRPSLIPSDAPKTEEHEKVMAYPQKEESPKQRPSLTPSNGPKREDKKELMADLQLDQEARQLKQRPTPRVGKPKPAFGPLTPSERPVVLPGGLNLWELMADLQLDQEARQLKQRPTPRVGKPKPAFGPLTPSERPVVLPGGRKWRKPKDAYNDAFIAETLTAQAEMIQGKALGVNFMKYEKPPITTDHLKNSEVYKLIHGMEQEPVKRVELLTPVIAEADYRELPTELDHLKNSEVYMLIHGMEQEPVKRVELLTPVIAEADYRELPSKLEYLKDSEVYKLIHDEEEEPLRGVKMLQYIIAETRYQEKCSSVTPADMRR